MSEKRFRKSNSKKFGSLEYKRVEANRPTGNASSKQRAGKFPSEADCSFEDTVVNLSSNQSVETLAVIFMTGHKAEPKWDSFIRGARGLILWKLFQMHELLTAMRSIFRKSRLLALDQQYRALSNSPAPRRDQTA